jgi:hypothetical protein
VSNLQIFLAICGPAWLLTARRLYRRWRGRQTGQRDCPQHGGPPRAKGCCYDGGVISDGEAAIVAMVAAFAFPLVWLAALVRWQPQFRRRRKLTDAELAALEREVGLGGK